MMTQAKYLSILLIIFLISLTGCGPKVRTEYVPYKIMTPIERCYNIDELQDIQFDLLNNEEYLCSFENTDK